MRRRGLHRVTGTAVLIAAFALLAAVPTASADVVHLKIKEGRTVMDPGSNTVIADQNAVVTSPYTWLLTRDVDSAGPMGYEPFIAGVGALAMGATTSQVTSRVVREGMGPVVAGLALGLMLAVVLARAARGLLFGVTPVDPPTLLGVGALLAAVGQLACLGPARRLARLDPVLVLRSD